MIPLRLSAPLSSYFGRKGRYRAPHPLLVLAIGNVLEQSPDFLVDRALSWSKLNLRPQGLEFEEFRVGKYFKIAAEIRI